MCYKIKEALHYSDIICIFSIFSPAVHTGFCRYCHNNNLFSDNSSPSIWSYPRRHQPWQNYFTWRKAIDYMTIHLKHCRCENHRLKALGNGTQALEMAQGDLSPSSKELQIQLMPVGNIKSVNKLNEPLLSTEELCELEIYIWQEFMCVSPVHVW